VDFLLDRSSAIIEHARGDVMADKDDRERSANRPWWVDAFDPAENLRALANVQDFGRLAAEELADRLQARSDGRDGGPAGPAPSEELDQLVRRFQADAVRAGDVWGALIDTSASLVGALLGAGLPARPGTAHGPAVVAPAPVPPGGEATAVFYVHNRAPVAVAAVRPHCAPPRSHLGAELADAVRFDPEVLDPLPARSSCGMEVRVRVPRGASPGTYASVILVSNVPELYLPLQVTVTGSEVGA
jgi:hypothetical protein